MDYREFTKRDVAYAEFIKIRKEVLDSVDNGSFSDVFVDVCARALGNDCVAQDCAAYFFNKGIPDRLYPNYDYYMRWQILAGANGNEFALEKMEFFLNPALELITNETELLKVAMLRRNITKHNALKVISNLLCEGIVDELQIKPKDLISINKKPITYSPDKVRVYTEAMEKCVTKVAEYLVS